MIDTEPRAEPRAGTRRTLTTADRLAARALAGPLTAAVAALAALQVLTWLPHYLTWPYWADHDVFATAARAWADGRPPYRDTVGNNFPGTIYLFYGLGTLVGWGKPRAWYALDAGILLTVCASLWFWSARRFGRLLPGAAGSLLLTSFMLGLDYSHAAQRDWQGPALACLAVLLAQCRPGTLARVAAGLLAAGAFAIRPQTILFWPGLVVAVLGSREAGAGADRRGRGLAATGLGLLAGLAAAFGPLAFAGVLDDFGRGVAVAGYGGTYNRVTPSGVLKGWVLQLSPLRWWAIPSAVLLLGVPFKCRAGASALPWLWVFAGVSLYKPLSPVAHSYLNIPLEVVGAVLSAALVGLILDRGGTVPAFRLAGVMLVMSLGGATSRPEFCVAGPTSRALKSFDVPPRETPPGYRRGTVPTSAFYPWDDYRALLDHLRERTATRTRVANLLKGDPAVTSMVDRPSALPAESVAWLRLVRPDDETRFADALRAAGDSVVVWSPGEVGPDPAFRPELLESVVNALYEPEASFGEIEVWRRKPGR